MKKTKSEFDVWFKAQYGALPNPTKRVKLSCRINELRTKANFMEQTANDMNSLELLYQGAKIAYFRDENNPTSV